MKCRSCHAVVDKVFVDLGTSPPSNAYLTVAQLQAPEKWFPLRVLVCQSCWLVQTEDFAKADELFDAEYSYLSSFSSSWLAHSERYATEMKKRLNLDASSLVVEVASNDGYLLQYFQRMAVPCYGVEPTKSTAEAARQRGIKVVEDFFGKDLGAKLAVQGKADLMAANNVLAHVPDINDFVAGFSQLLKPGGTATFEFPHLLQLVLKNQFDTIYHEHFSYLSLHALTPVFERNGLSVYDVEELRTHGGSLRLFVSHQGRLHATPSVDMLMEKERQAGLTASAFYEGFQKKAEKVKDDFLEFLLMLKKQGKSVVGYGAAAKGNTLLNFAGTKADLLPYVIDANTSKQGKFLPGSRIPIVTEDIIRKLKPDYIVILPWNLKAEVSEQLSYARDWGAKFVVAVPEMEIL